jgi:hypothetical protein
MNPITIPIPQELIPDTVRIVGFNGEVFAECPLTWEQDAEGRWITAEPVDLVMAQSGVVAEVEYLRAGTPIFGQPIEAFLTSIGVPGIFQAPRMRTEPFQEPTERTDG